MSYFKRYPIVVNNEGGEFDGDMTRQSPETQRFCSEHIENELRTPKASGIFGELESEMERALSRRASELAMAEFVRVTSNAPPAIRAFLAVEVACHFLTNAAVAVASMRAEGQTIEDSFHFCEEILLDQYSEGMDKRLASPLVIGGINAARAMFREKAGLRPVEPATPTVKEKTVD